MAWGGGRGGCGFHPQQSSLSHFLLPPRLFVSPRKVSSPPPRWSTHAGTEGGGAWRRGGWSGEGRRCELERGTGCPPQLVATSSEEGVVAAACLGCKPSTPAFWRGTAGGSSPSCCCSTGEDSGEAGRVLLLAACFSKRCRSSCDLIVPVPSACARIACCCRSFRCCVYVRACGECVRWEGTTIGGRLRA